ncbi:MAG: dihydropteroate synthase [Saprospiraceae bacterium]|nr:dihydropteroate synthase [Bacteroidia bacterium]NNL90908.1 dihydropteroate synthase [Saprospiraceae bacterium]
MESPVVMGILNLTPDSFFDGGKYDKIEDALLRVEQMKNEGAQIIDIGGFSSRPSAQMISVSEELDRIIPLLKEATQTYPNLIFSVDTFRSEVVDTIAKFTAIIVNDITAGKKDEKLIDCVSAHGFPYVLMHMQGSPETMQVKPEYDDVCFDILNFFSSKLTELRKKGIDDIILDPGFGFGKTIEHNYAILKNLELYSVFELPILAGLSRKSMIYKVLKTKSEDALNGTTALHWQALMQGASILRVHDVKEAVQTITLFEHIKTS